MKVLSVKQPWAYLICSGIKDIENRTWRCPQKYIGQRALIHASTKPDNIKLDMEGQATVKEIQLLSALNYCDENELYSVIIGSVEIVDCVVNHPSIWAEKTYYDKFEDTKPIYNWVLSNPILFDHPILGVKGKLRFWNSQYEEIVCPNCDRVQLAEVVEKLPWNSYIHNCPCGYTIMESEWNRY